MSDGTCAFCEADYIVTADGVPACKEHIGAAMQPMRDRVGEIVRTAIHGAVAEDVPSL